jgi:hypothetical protein
MAANGTGVEVVDHRGRVEIVIAQTQIFVALDVAAGVKRSVALGADVRQVAGLGLTREYRWGSRFGLGLFPLGSAHMFDFLKE